MTAGEHVIVKLGGAALEDLAPSWWDDLAHIASAQPLVIVHGWSKPLRRLRDEYALPTAIIRDRFGNQSRWTTPEVIGDIRIVSLAIRAVVECELRKRGVTLRHVFGSDGALHAGPAERLWWQGNELVELDNRVGPIVRVDTSSLPAPSAFNPVLVSPLATNDADQEVNTDADRAAAAIAGALGAERLALVTDVSHLIIDGSPVSSIDAADAARFRDHHATGGMRKKLRAADEALRAGVGRVHIGKADVSALLHRGVGTVIVGPHDRQEGRE